MPISLRLSPESVRRLDALVKDGGYEDRSEAIRDALALLEQTLEADEDEEVVIRLRKADLERLQRARIFKWR